MPRASALSELVPPVAVLVHGVTAKNGENRLDFTLTFQDGALVDMNVTKLILPAADNRVGVRCS
jgi:hypothetical protein